METFKDVRGFEGIYQVSNLGRVRSLRREILYKDGRSYIKEECMLHNNPGYKGYLYVNLSYHSKLTVKRAHKLVSVAFLGDDGSLQVNHKDGNKHNNHVSNLELVTGSENQIHAVRMGIRNTKLSMDDIVYIKSNKHILSRILAAKFNVNVSLIRLIKKNMIWKHVQI